MRLGYAAIIAAFVAACANQSSVTCDNGEVCPEGTVCVTDHAPTQCVLPEQTTICGSLANGDVCRGDKFAGICDEGLCLPGCGDGVQDTGEQCDDGNFASHDGCSSACLTEQATWSEWQNPWRPRTMHAAAYDANTNTLVITAGVTPDGNDGATWVRNALGWKRLDSNAPSVTGAAVAYDPVRHVVVMFGGNGVNDDGTDATWELANGAWKQVNTATKPAPRTLAAMAYDSVRGTMIMYGGSVTSTASSETWEYDGTNWTKLSPANKPMALIAHAMVYDPVRQATVLFGGTRATNQNDTWLFSSATGNWTKLTTAVAPAARDRFGMVFAPSRGSVMLFGGGLASLEYGSDLWELTGNTWTQIQTATSPPPRKDHTLTLVGTKLVVVGGAAEELYDDVWELDLAVTPLQWTKVDVGLSPSNRASELVYDAQHRQLVLFGGTPRGDVPNDTWAFDAKGWKQLAPGLPPPLVDRGNNAIAYDPTGTRTVIVDGQGGGALLDETVAWDGTTWTKIGGGPTPVRKNASFVFDDAGTGVLFGGENEDVAMPHEVYTDTWELTGSTWTAPSNPGTAPLAGSAFTYDPIRKAVVAFDISGTTLTYSDHAWHALPTDVSPPRRTNAVMGFDATRGTTILVGGHDVDTFYNDLWELHHTGETDTWSRVPIVGGPPPPRREWFGNYSPALHSFVIFGASSPSRLRDTWYLAYRSTTPEEACGDGMDNDHDLQVDAADPDCQ